MDGLAYAAANSALSLFDGLPEGLLDSPVNKLDSVLPGPSLISIAGEREPPLFVSILLHGNEVTGLLTLQQLLREFRAQERPLPRSLLLFVGNVQAARYGVRRLAGQADYNRIWAGGNQPEHIMAERLLHELRGRELFAAVDIHNNTGKNPLYACINRIDPRFINLARQFSKTLVYFTEPREVIAMAMAEFCPSVTLECGQPGELEGISRASAYLQHCLTLDTIDTTTPTDDEVDIFHTVAKILVPKDASVGFAHRENRYDICLPEDFDSLNFRLLPHDSHFGWRYNKAVSLRAVDNDMRDVSDQYFCYEEDDIVTRRRFLPSMLTKDVRVIYQDCLGYIMEHYPINDRA